MAELSQRQRQILYACVSEFVSTGQPVGSRTLARKGIDLSPATIRNVLAELEDAGFLRQPHTSAGRVPTDRAFRIFIDALMELEQLSAEAHARIQARFSEITPGDNVMRETGRLLSELTGAAAVVVAPRAELTLKHLRFIRTNPGEVLAVLVMSNGVVQNRFLRADVTEDELLRLHNLLDDVIEGRTLGELHDLFDRRLQSERVQADSLKKRAFELGDAAIAGIAEARADLVIEGRSRLLDLPEFADAGGTKAVVSALDEHERIVELLTATMDAKGTAIVVGEEAGELGGGQLAIVGASYTENGRAAGTIGVIGPTRMDYPKVVPLVTATADAMSAYMDRNKGAKAALGSKGEPRTFSSGSSGDGPVPGGGRRDHEE
ncbi:MAG: heat-inducible transcription repressor HrcA [Myxococcales bacterium]|jgi:heat-inducible transcriptional repressor|nr:heat-inducible transcription repressor HrcA [Myxococcales bacterium]